MSQLEGGRAQAGFIRSGGGNIQRQQIGSLDVRPLAVTPPVSASANQLAQASETLAAFASTVKEGGRYAEWLRTQREAEAERQRLAMANEMKRVDAIEKATAEFDQASGSVVGKAFKQQYLIDLEKGSLPIPDGLSGVDKAMYVRQHAILAAQEKYGDRATPAFIEGVAKELDPDAFLRAAQDRLEAKQKEDADTELAARRSVLLGITDLKQIEGVVEETSRLLEGIHPPEYVRKELLTPAIEAAAVAGDPDRVAMLAKPLGGLEAKWVSERMDEAKKIGEQAEKNRLHQANQDATAYLTDAIVLGGRFDPGIAEYVDFAYKQKAITADERNTWMSKIQSASDKHSAEVQKRMDEEEAANQANAAVSKNLSYILDGQSYLAGDVKTTVGSATKSVSLEEQKRMAFGMVVADSAKLYPNDPTAQVSHQIDYVSQSKNFPTEWTQILQVGASAADSLMLDTADGKDSPIPTQTVAGLELYKALSARAPHLLSSMVAYDDRKFYERTMSEMRRGAVGGDVRKAMLAAKVSIQTRPSRVDIGGQTLLDTLGAIGVSPTNGIWGGANPMFTSIENELTARADLFADLTPAEAAKKAASEIEPNLVRVNGFTMFMVNPPATGNKESFQNVLSDRLAMIARDKGVDVANLYTTEDMRTGMIRVSDRSTLTPVDTIDPRDLAKPVSEDRAKSAVLGQNFTELVTTNPALMVEFNRLLKSMSERDAMRQIVGMRTTDTAAGFIRK